MRSRKLTIVKILAVLFLVLGALGWFFPDLPFPAFAFFFISIFVLIFLEMRRTAVKLSISVLDLVVNRKKLPSSKKLILIGIGILGIAVALCFLIPFGLDKQPMLVIFGFISFAITMLLVILTSLVYTLRVQGHLARHHFDLWKKSLFSSSLQVRYQAGMQLRSLKGPVERKWAIICNRIGLSFFFIWLILFIVATIVVIILDLIGKI